MPAPTANATRQLRPLNETTINRSGPHRSPTAPKMNWRDTTAGTSSPATSTSATSVASHIALDAHPSANDATTITVQVGATA